MYIFKSMVKNITSLKGNLCMYKSQTFLINFVFDYKRKITKCTRFKMDFVSNFVMHVLIRFHLLLDFNFLVLE